MSPVVVAIKIAGKKAELVDATIRLVMRQGVTSTSVDQICAEAGVTKGSFFHYFPNKEAIVLAAMDQWAGAWLNILENAGFEQIADPLDRLERLFAVMLETYLNPCVETGCLVGTVAQELAASNRRLGDPCSAHFDTWLAGVTAMLADAKAAHPPPVEFDPAEVAQFLISIVQGAMLVAKTQQSREGVAASVTHARSYIRFLFGRKEKS